MKTQLEMESLCGRILLMLEHDDLRRSTVVTLSDTLAGLATDLRKHLADWRSADAGAAELISAEDTLRSMSADVVWVQEYAGRKPLMEVIQRVRMATLRALRIVTLLQGVMAESAQQAAAARQAQVAAP